MSTIPRATHCAPCAKPAVAILHRAMRASATKRCTRHWRILKPILTKKFTWKTTLCFRATIRWKRLHNQYTNLVSHESSPEQNEGSDILLGLEIRNREKQDRIHG